MQLTNVATISQPAALVPVPVPLPATRGKWVQDAGDLLVASDATMAEAHEVTGGDQPGKCHHRLVGPGPVVVEQPACLHLDGVLSS